MKSEKIQKLEQLSKDLLNGQVSPMKVFSLSPFDRLSVMGGWFLCSLTRIGVLSSKTGREIHLKQLQEVDEIIRSTETFAQSHLRWIRIGIDTSCLRTEIVKAIRQEDGLNIVELMAKIIDLYTGENIYFKMLQARYKDESFKQNIMRSAMENIDSLQKQFGNDVPYLRLLEGFFRCCDEDGITELYRDLEPEEIIKVSDVPDKVVPEAYDESLKTIKRNVERMYPKRY